MKKKAKQNMKQRSNKDRTTEYVYSLPTPTARSQSDVPADDKVVMEDGPVPMKNLKSAQKYPNGNDNFLQEHQTEYVRPTSDQIRRVDTHNNAYPKLIDELNKKRSATKVNALCRTAGATQTLLHYDPIFKRRVELSQARKNDPKLKANKRKHLERRSRVTKYKTQQRNSTNKKYAPTKFFSRNKSVQHFPHIMNTGTSPEKPFILAPLQFKMESETNQLGSFSGRHAATEFQDRKEQSTKESSSMIPSKKGSSRNSKRNTVSSEPSISSYNSYLSMDHEPMV